MSLQGNWVYKIPDIWRSLKPFDIVCCRNWKFVAIEVKKVLRKKEVEESIIIERSKKLLEPHQVVALKKISSSWWEAYLVVYEQSKRVFYILKI